MLTFLAIYFSAFEFEGAKPFAAVRFDEEAAAVTAAAAAAASSSSPSQSSAPAVSKAAPDHMIKLVVKHL